MLQLHTTWYTYSFVWKRKQENGIVYICVSVDCRVSHMFTTFAKGSNDICKKKKLFALAGKIAAAQAKIYTIHKWHQAHTYTSRMHKKRKLFFFISFSTWNKRNKTTKSNVHSFANKKKCIATVLTYARCYIVFVNLCEWAIAAHKFFDMYIYVPVCSPILTTAQILRFARVL